MRTTIRKIASVTGFALLIYIIILSLIIENFTTYTSSKHSDVAIVLGAGVSNGNLSPVFKERINHAIKIYHSGLVENIIFTGGFGEGEKYSDSWVAKKYAIEQGNVPPEKIFIEEKSTNTYQNIHQAKLIMDKESFGEALLVSDPLHMRRSLAIAESLGVVCDSSPTKTTMYQSTWPKIKFLAYEVFFFTLDILLGHI